VIIGENGGTLKGHTTAARPECAVPPGTVVVFRLNSAQLVHMFGESQLGIAGTAYRVSGDCKALEEIRRVDLTKTDDELAADFGVDGTVLEAPDPGPGPVKIVKSFYEAVNRGEVEAAIALVGDNPTFGKEPLVPHGPGGPPREGADTKEGVRQRITELVDQAYTIELKELRPGRLRATYAYRVLQEGREVASGEGITRIKNGRIVDDRDLVCTPDEGCTPAIVFVSSGGMRLKPRGPNPSGPCRLSLSSRGGSAAGQDQTIRVGLGVAVVFRDAMNAPDGVVGPGDQVRAGEAFLGVGVRARQGSIYQIVDGCRLLLIGTVAGGRSDAEIEAAFGIGALGGDSVIPQGAARRAKQAPAGLEATAIRKVWPEYPPAARAAGIGGVVEVEVQIDESGDVVNARVVRMNGGPFFVEAAVKAARQWKFRPLLQEGRSVKSGGILTFRFGDR
jgi:TonB family protein